jgi:beta-galactosidase
VSDCSQSGCGEHNSSMSNRWPSTILAYGTITGTVTDVANVPVAGATVTNDRAQSTPTDANGIYTFTSVPAGTTAVNVTVAKTGFITQSKAVTFADGQTVTLDVKLSRLGSIQGVVTEGGSPLAGVTVSITGSSFVTLGDGKFSFAGKTAGSYTVTFAKAGYTTQTKSVVVANDDAVDASVVLAPLPNLALARPFAASRYQDSPALIYAPANAGDANAASFWWSSSNGGSTTTEWLTVDLGSSKSISKVDVVWFDGYWAKNFRILTSTSTSMPSAGSNSWTSVYSTTNGAGGTSLVSFNSRNARWVRIECQRTSGVSTGYGVAEMRVFQ